MSVICTFSSGVSAPFQETKAGVPLGISAFISFSVAPLN